MQSLIGGAWYQAPILISESVGVFFIFNQCLVHKLPLAMQKEAPSCVTSRPPWQERMRVCSSLCQGWRLAHLFMLTATSGLLRNWENASFCLHQDISSFLYLCTCYLPVLFEILCWFCSSIPSSKRRVSLSVFV